MCFFFICFLYFEFFFYFFFLNFIKLFIKKVWRGEGDVSLPVVLLPVPEMKLRQNFISFLFPDFCLCKKCAFLR